jgi:N-acetylglucosamine kinase-like BadF-type ATPase
MTARYPAGPLILGLDIGGSRTRGRLCADGRLVAEASGPSASLSAAGAERAAEVLDALLVELGRPSVAAAVAGAAGCDTASGRARMGELLGPLLPGARLEVVHDTRLVLAAAGLDAGIVLIGGTGSVAWGLSPSGVEARAGGWGHLLGDEGSGYWLVRTAVRRVLAGWDRGEAPTALTRRLLALTGATEPLELPAHLHRQREPAHWAGFSRDVLDAEPDLAREAAAALAEQVRTVAARIGLAGPVVMAGGLLLGEPSVERALREAVPETELLRASEAPVAGAVRLAERLAAARF